MRAAGTVWPSRDCTMRCVRALIVAVCATLLHEVQDGAALEERPQLYCRLGSRACRDGSECVLLSHVCDGDEDCPDGSDEDKCDLVCSSDQFQCAHGKLCIDRSLVCDGVPQCQDRSDEKKCFKSEDSCGHQCGDHCLPASFVCDGQDDCGDGSDEADCENQAPEDEEWAPEDEGQWSEAEGENAARPHLHCRVGSKACRDGSKCVLYSHVCDGEDDCNDSSDEDECDQECERGQFQCEHGKLCIDGGLVCDGVPQCQDRSDEVGCSELGDDCGHRCHKRCLPESFVCDGQEDCEDGSDEADCGAESCGGLDFRCRSGQCVSLSSRCDGHSDCRDRSDEDNCTPGDGCTHANCTESPVQCGEFQWECVSKTQCVPQSWHCDGTKDCRDGSDEASCEPVPCRHQFRCGSSDCLDFSLICDGNEDCPDGSDEGGACSDLCDDQSQCAQQCHRTPGGPRCWCSEGYRSVDAGAVCVDADECAESPAVCAHSCVNSEGSFQCSCYHGYVLGPDGRSCEATGVSYLLAAVQSEVLLLDLQKTSPDVSLSTEGRPVLSLDYDWQGQRVYWLDAKAVRWTTLDEKTRGTLVSGVTAECVAVDWVGRSLYWMDRADGQIKAVGLEGAEPVVVVEEDVEELQELALLPQKGLMFWSETGVEPQIERAGMDGSDRRVLLRDSLRRPEGLAVDLLQERLYWTDAELHCIGSAALDGGDVKMLQLMETPAPFSLSVFGEMVYWSDAHSRTIQRAHKVTGKQHQILLRRPGQHLHIKVMNELLQPSAENPCVSARCSHLCVLAPGLKGVCKCPSGLRLDRDGLTCSKSEDSAFLMLLSPTAVTQVSLQSRLAGVDLKDWPDHQRVELPGASELRALDLSVRHQLLYVWDAGRTAVAQYRVKGAGASPQGTPFNPPEDTLTALAVDWTTLNLYWSSVQPGLRVTSPKEGLTAVILEDEVRNASSITLQPAAGCMCFTNTVQLRRTLECSNMDGQNRTVVWTSAVDPVSLSLSRDADRLYWADLSLGVVASVGTQGSGYRQMKTEDGLVTFALADTLLVWVTQRGSTRCWFSADQQAATLWFDVKAEVVDVKAFSKAAQKGSGPCSSTNGGCAQLCLPSPGGRVCACGSGFLSVNGVDCVLETPCPDGAQRCAGVDECVPQERLCDGRPDCSDASDEICNGTQTDQSPVSKSPAGGPRAFNTPDGDGVEKSKDHGVVPAPISPSPAVPSSDREVKVDGEACRVRVCSGNGECVRRDGATVCQCDSGYGGPRCEDSLGGVIQGPVVYAAGGVCVAVIVLGVTVGIIQKRKAARQRQERTQQTATQDPEGGAQPTPAPPNSGDLQQTEDASSPVD